ncbi:hypothetical protein RI543_001919 [Arxiozyma heterogenica]|uniref:Uncharacterized protein n=1 Tax=Arxiozyma heterogenica TaxID=278026 RepID=A0AAN7ZST1_9SACH|nr:hypothetical protein RI543_001919 [Kazachstania heterogenica]
MFSQEDIVSVEYVDLINKNKIVVSNNERVSTKKVPFKYLIRILSGKILLHHNFMLPVKDIGKLIAIIYS